MQGLIRSCGYKLIVHGQTNGLWLCPRVGPGVCGYAAGLDQEGIFRVNGNTRVVERLRGGFDKTGDAELTSTGDVMAVASVLKLFLRELPDTLIPAQLTALFVSAQGGQCTWF